MLIIIISLFCLAPYQNLIRAQENAPWEAVLIAMSNDGRHLAVNYGAYDKEDDSADYDSGVWLYNLDDLLSPPQYLAGAHFYGTKLTFSPDDQQLAVSGGSRAKIIDTEDYSPILEVSHTSTEIPTDFYMLSYSPDSKHFMSFSHFLPKLELEMSVWEIETGAHVLAVPAPRSRQFVNRPWLSPNWKQFLDWSGSSEIKINEFDIEQGLGRRLATLSENHTGVAFSSDASLFALATDESEIKVFRTDPWELAYIQLLGQYSCGGVDVTLAFGHIKPWLVFQCHWTANLLIWDYETGELLLQNDEGIGRFRQISRNDGILVAATLTSFPERSVITVWDANNEFEMTVYPGKNPQLHPNGELMATIGPDRKVWIWNIKLKQLLVIFPVPQMG